MYFLMVVFHIPNYYILFSQELPSLFTTNPSLKQKKGSDLSTWAFVQKKGLEPSQYCYHTDLNRTRLPIPPLLQTINVSIDRLNYSTAPQICQLIFGIFRIKISLKKFQKSVYKLFELCYIMSCRWDMRKHDSRWYAEVSELADEQD